MICHTNNNNKKQGTANTNDAYIVYMDLYKFVFIVMLFAILAKGELLLILEL